MNLILKFIRSTFIIVLFYVLLSVIVAQFFRINAAYNIILILVYYIYIFGIYLLSVLLIYYYNFKIAINFYFIIFIHVVFVMIFLVKLFF